MWPGRPIVMMQPMQLAMCGLLYARVACGWQMWVVMAAQCGWQMWVVMAAHARFKLLLTDAMAAGGH